MKLRNVKTAGYSLGEMVIVVAVVSFMLLAVLTSSISLQKSLNATNDYFSVQLQQIRIVDYLSRDAKRSYVVSAATAPESVTCTIPNYLIENGDPDIAVGVGKRRTPTVTKKATGITVSYGSRTVNDAGTTNGSPTLTSATAVFTAGDVGKGITGAGIPGGTSIAAYTNATTVTLSQNASATATDVTATFGPASKVSYTISGQSILRTEDGVLTTVASSTDSLLPDFTEVQLALANTEYLSTTITFLPVFATGMSTNNQNTSRAGTTIYSTAYLRNKRRG